MIIITSWAGHDLRLMLMLCVRLMTLGQLLFMLLMLLVQLICVLLTKRLLRTCCQALSHRLLSVVLLVLLLMLLRCVHHSCTRARTRCSCTSRYHDYRLLLHHLQLLRERIPLRIVAGHTTTHAQGMTLQLMEAEETQKQ